MNMVYCYKAAEPLREESLVLNAKYPGIVVLIW